MEKRIFKITLLLLFLLSPSPSFAALGDATISSNGLLLSTKGSFAGGIVELKLNDFNYMNQTVDRGVGIQTAWQNNNAGECFNPTHQGSRQDGTGPTTTSILLNFSNTQNSITATLHPAYWLQPGESSDYCNWTESNQTVKGLAQNTTVASDSILNQKYTLNPDDFSNLIEVDGSIIFKETDTQPNPLRYIVIEQPTVVLVKTFSKAFRYALSTDTLTPLNSAADIYTNLHHPPILSTEDGAHAISLYSNQIPLDGFENGPQKPFVGYNLNDLRSLWGIWSMNVRVPYSAKDFKIVADDKLNLRSFILVGTLQEVRSNLQKLYQKHPPLSLDCQSIAWTDKPLEPSSCLSADANSDSKTDLLDFAIWKKEYLGKLDTKTTDFNHDSIVNLLDFGVWKKVYLLN